MVHLLEYYMSPTKKPLCIKNFIFKRQLSNIKTNEKHLKKTSHHKDQENEKNSNFKIRRHHSLADENRNQIVINTCSPFDAIYSSSASNNEKIHAQLENQIKNVLEKLWPDNLEDDNQALVKHGSSFDKLLLVKWLLAMENGAFKYKLSSQLPTKYLEGKYKFLVQINPLRITQKRPSEIRSQSLNVDFDRNKFNFTRINDNEILFKLSSNMAHLNGTLPENNSAIQQYISHCDLQNSNSNLNDNYIIINNSPIEFGHILLLPQMRKCMKQVLNLDAINLAIDVSFLTKSNGLFIGFNSTNAFSSVNHLHIHAYYFGNKQMSNRDNDCLFPIPLQNVHKARLICDKVWFIEREDYYFPALAMQLSDFNDNTTEFAKRIIMITDHFNRNEIPHNLVLVKSKIFIDKDLLNEDEKNYVDINEIKSLKTTLRVHIWPRKSSYDTPANDKQISFAICEMAGHFLLKDELSYEEITEDEIVSLSHVSQLDDDELKAIMLNIKKIFK